MRKLKAFESGDGAHCGLSDLYQAKEYALRRAILGKSDFTTGWYSSKKEIASAQISRVDGVYTIDVSVSDDFDTEGYGQESFKTTSKSANFILEKIVKAIFVAWEEAENNQKQNREYAGLSILKDGKCIETYIQNVSGMLDTPPGDNYHKWGFQGEARLPKEVKEKLADWAESFPTENEFTYNGYTIRKWRD